MGEVAPPNVIVAEFPLWQRFLLKDTVISSWVLGWLCPVQLMVPLLHPVVHSDSLAKHIPHGDRDLTTRSRCCR